MIAGFLLPGPILTPRVKFTLVDSTRKKLVNVTLSDGRVKKKAEDVPAVEVHFRDVVLAVFSELNEKGNLNQAAQSYINVYGYLAEWRRQALITGTVPSWTEEMRVDVTS